MKVILGWVAFFLFFLGILAVPLKDGSGVFAIIIAVILVIIIIVKSIREQTDRNFIKTEQEKRINELERIRLNKIDQQKQKEKEFNKVFTVRQRNYFSRPYVNKENKYSSKEFYEKETKDSITRKSIAFIRKYIENLDAINRCIKNVPTSKYSLPAWVSGLEYYPLELSKLETYPPIIIGYLFDQASRTKFDNELTEKWNQMLKYRSRHFPQLKEDTWQKYRDANHDISLTGILDKYDIAVMIDKQNKAWKKKEEEERRNRERIRDKERFEKQRKYDLKNSKVGVLIELSKKNNKSYGLIYAGVYLIVNNKTLDFYIGESQNLEFRKKTHFGDLVLNTHHSSLMQKHFNEYGKGVFDFYVLEETHMDDSVGTARKRIEEFYINKYHPTYNFD